MQRLARRELNERLKKYVNWMKECGTLLDVFRSLLYNRTYSSCDDFLVQVRRFVMEDLLLLRGVFAVQQL